MKHAAIHILSSQDPLLRGTIRANMITWSYKRSVGILIDGRKMRIENEDEMEHAILDTLDFDRSLGNVPNVVTWR